MKNCLIISKPKVRINEPSIIITNIVTESLNNDKSQPFIGVCFVIRYNNTKSARNLSASFFSGIVEHLLYLELGYLSRPIKKCRKGQPRCSTTTEIPKESNHRTRSAPFCLRLDSKGKPLFFGLIPFVVERYYFTIKITLN